MLTIAYIAGGGSEYYLDKNSQTSEYYLNGQSRTYWGGGAVENLGLGPGEINKADFDRLMEGHVPDGGRIGNSTKDGDWKHDPGRDLTFSDPKSISILMQGPLRDEILKIKRKAVLKSMSYAEEKFAQTRINGEVVDNQKLVWAAVNEETSRANDMNGHTHVVLFNMVEGQDGKFRALHNQLLYDNSVLLGQIYRSEIAAGIKKLGFEIEPVGQHGQWEIKDIPEDIRQTFSKRRKAIVEKINPNNDTAKAREAICLVTRPSKQNIGKEKLLETWSKELGAHGTTLAELSRPKNKSAARTPYSIDERVKSSMNIIAETNSSTLKYDLYRKVMDITDGHFTIDQLEDEVSRQLDKKFLVLSEDGHYLAKSIDKDREKQVTKELQKGHLKSKPFMTKRALESALNDTHLKDDQKAAINLFLRHTSRYAKIQGDAGTGKTTALQTAVPLIQAAGYKVIGLSTTQNSTEELEKTGVFDKVMTLQRYLLVPEGDQKTVLVVDESSMIGTKQMLSLTQFTNKKQMPRVLFQGDGNQMSGVQAGEPFKYMEKSGVRSVVMDEIIRQKDGRHRKGITELTRADLKNAFQTLKPEILEVSSEALMDHAVKAWRQTGDTKTPIIVQTNKQKTGINQAIKAEQIKANPDANSLTLKTWQRVYKTDTEKAFVRTYKDASHIRFNRDYKRFGITRGNIYKIESLDEQAAEIQLSRDGQKHSFRPAQFKMGSGAVELYRQEQRTLHEGDRIRFTRGGHLQPVNNNESATIKEIKGDKVTFDKDRGKQKLTLSLKDNYIRHIDHAWASTTHAYQGKTVDHAVVLMPSRKSPLTTLESLYTSASRHRLTVTIVTDDAEKLKRNISKAIDVQNMEANIKWPEQEAVKDTYLQTQNGVLERLKDRSLISSKSDRSILLENSTLNSRNDDLNQNQKNLRQEKKPESQHERGAEESYGMGM